MSTRKQEITWDDFQKIDLRIGTIVHAEVFKEARNPAYKLSIDFGEDIGVLKSSAQITERYQPEDLINRQIVAVVNFPAKQIGPMQSQCLCTGVVGDPKGVVLIQPEQEVENGRAIA